MIAGASRREAADCFDVSASSAVKWLQLWQETGSVAAKPTGGSISPLEEHADWLLALIFKQSDLTRRNAVWRFFKRHNISFKKTIWDGVAPVGVETLGLYRAPGRERPSAFWWRVTP